MIVFPSPSVSIFFFYVPVLCMEHVVLERAGHNLTVAPFWCVLCKVFVCSLCCFGMFFLASFITPLFFFSLSPLSTPRFSSHTNH